MGNTEIFDVELEEKQSPNTECSPVQYGKENLSLSEAIIKL
jgi:hypothetical protein